MAWRWSQGSRRGAPAGLTAEDVAADDVEDRVDSPTPSKGSASLQECLRTEAEHDIAVVGASGADHLSTQLAWSWTAIDPTRRQRRGPNGLAGGGLGMDEQSLPRGQPEIGSAAATVWSMSAAKGRRASTAVYSASERLRLQSVQAEHPLLAHCGAPSAAHQAFVPFWHLKSGPVVGWSRPPALGSAEPVGVVDFLRPTGLRVGSGHAEAQEALKVWRVSDDGNPGAVAPGTFTRLGGVAVVLCVGGG